MLKDEGNLFVIEIFTETFLQFCPSILAVFWMNGCLRFCSDFFDLGQFWVKLFVLVIRVIKLWYNLMNYELYFVKYWVFEVFSIGKRILSEVYRMKYFTFVTHTQTLFLIKAFYIKSNMQPVTNIFSVLSKIIKIILFWIIGGF